jgi:putative transposase
LAAGLSVGAAASQRSLLPYRSAKDPKLALRGRMREIARTRVRYSYRRIHVLLRREG